MPTTQTFYTDPQDVAGAFYQAFLRLKADPRAAPETMLQIRVGNLSIPSLPSKPLICLLARRHGFRPLFYSVSAGEEPATLMVCLDLMVEPSAKPTAANDHAYS